MPGMDGFQLARWFRQSPAASAVTLIAVTGWGQAEDRRRTREAGFDHHFVKPVEADAVRQVLCGLDPQPADEASI
jgi:CheY-like chemotaxis protein